MANPRPSAPRDDDPPAPPPGFLPSEEPLEAWPVAACASCGGTEFEVRVADEQQPGVEQQALRVCVGCEAAEPLRVVKVPATTAPAVPERFVVHGRAGARWRLPESDGDAPSVAMAAVLDPENPDALALEVVGFGEPPAEPRYEWETGVSTHYYCQPPAGKRRELYLRAKNGGVPQHRLVELVHLECLDIPAAGAPPRPGRLALSEEEWAELTALTAGQVGRPLRELLVPEGLDLSHCADGVRPSVGTLEEWAALPLWEPPGR